MNDVLQQALEQAASAQYLRSLCGKPLGEILKISAGLTQERLEEGLAAQAEKGGRLGEVLVGLKYVSEEDVAKALGVQLDIPYVGRIGIEDVDQELLKMVPINFAKQTRILPLGMDGELVALAVADPRKWRDSATAARGSSSHAMR